MIAWLTLSGCAGAPGRTADGRDGRQLARREQRVADGAIGSRDHGAESAIAAELCQIDADSCTAIRVYVIDRPEAQARLWPNDMLIITSGLLHLIDAAGSQAAAEPGDMRRFALAHELAHRQLDHFGQRGRPGWDADAAERAADRHAIEALNTARKSPDAGIQLLQAIIGKGDEDERSADRLRGRIAAMKVAIGQMIESSADAAVRGDPPIKSASGAGPVEP